MAVNNVLKQKLYRAAGFIAAAVGLLIIFISMNGGKSGSHLAFGIFQYFSYFTILSNMMVAMWFAAHAFFPASRLPAWLRSPAVKGALLVYITITGLIYHFMLRDAWPQSSVQHFGSILLHYVAPVWLVMDWILWDEKGLLEWIYSVLWLGFPLVYMIYILITGAFSRYYPYFFMDAAKLGYFKVIMNSFLIGLGFLFVSLLYILIDRRLDQTGSLRMYTIDSLPIRTSRHNSDLF